MKIRAVAFEAQEGGYLKVPALQGLYAQAETLDELRSKLREAVELYLTAPHHSAGESTSSPPPGRW